MAPPPTVPATHPLSVVFLLHIFMELPLAVQGMFWPASLPFIQLNNTVVVIMKLYAALSLGICATTLLCWKLPEFLPGKRALAIGLCIYHTALSTILYQAPRFIPQTLGQFAESLKITPENVWGTVHGFLGLLFVAWWQFTVGAAAAVGQQGR
ncbi:hypothetical protein HDZ31DRAFT_42966 [Schizophyllum fasciatum]